MRKKAGYNDRLKRNTCTALQYYLTTILPRDPKGADFKFTNSFEFNGDNDNLVIDLSQLSEQAQTLVIGSIAYEILNRHQDTILVVPDGWTMFDSTGASLGRLHIESLISKGSQNRNYVVIESDSIEDIPMHLRRQMSTIILGYQSWADEVRIKIRALRDLASHLRRNRIMKGVEKPFLTRFEIQRLKIGNSMHFPHA